MKGFLGFFSPVEELACSWRKLKGGLVVGFESKGALIHTPQFGTTFLLRFSTFRTVSLFSMFCAFVFILTFFNQFLASKIVHIPHGSGHHAGQTVTNTQASTQPREKQVRGFNPDFLF